MSDAPDDESIPEYTLPPQERLPGFTKNRTSPPTAALVILWAVDQPSRVGEVLFMQPDGSVGIFGRDETSSKTNQSQRLNLVKQRPNGSSIASSLKNPRISRSQLELQLRGTSEIDVRSIGRCPMLINGTVQTEHTLTYGDVVELKNQLLLLCTQRRRRMPLQEDHKPHDFGQPDHNGIVGESPAIWQLREQVLRGGRRKNHILLTGPSGSGKELLARALHAAGKQGPLISRNAATLPEGLIDAELFGNLKNYPNPGMVERVGLIGQADGGTLFLDEIGELPEAAQTRLLRVLDEGEYQRLGESQTRTSHFRLVGATNRPPEQLKNDVLARFKLHIQLPGLNERLEDIPLLIPFLFQKMVQEDPSLAERFSSQNQSSLQVRTTPSFITTLVRRHWDTNIRELEKILWRSVDSSTGPYLDLSSEALLSKTRPSAPSGDPVTPEEIRAALKKHNGVQEKAWRDLELGSRHVLARLMKKHGIKAK